MKGKGPRILNPAVYLSALSSSFFPISCRRHTKIQLAAASKRSRRPAAKSFAVALALMSEFYRRCSVRMRPYEAVALLIGRDHDGQRGEVKAT